MGFKTESAKSPGSVKPRLRTLKRGSEKDVGAVDVAEINCGNFNEDSSIEHVPRRIGRVYPS